MACKHCGGLTTGKNQFCSRGHATSYNNRKRIRVPGGIEKPKTIRRVRFRTDCPICGKLHKNKTYCSKECQQLSQRIKALKPQLPDMFEFPPQLLDGDAAI